MALRDMFISIGYVINPEGLSEADQRANAFRDNLLGAEAQGQQMGAAIAAAGATATASMGEAAQAAEGLAGWWEVNQQRVEGFGAQLKEYRKILAGISGATLGVIGFSIKTAADFEAAMSRVAAISGASDEELKLLTKTAEQLGATTVFSATQAAEGMQYLAMAGFSVEETIAAMPGLLDAAAAAKADLGRTADIVSNILSGFGLAAGEAGRVADVLTATFTSSNTTLESLGETMKMVAPVAAALGIEIEEVAALTAVLGDAGIQGSMAGTSLRMILTSLAAPTGAAAKAVEELGLQITDAAGNMLPITSIIDQIAQKTADMGAAQRAAYLEALAGRQGVSALSAIMQVGAARIDEYAASLRGSAGIAAEVAAKQMDNLHGALEEMRSAWEGAQIAIGNAFIPVLRLGARALTAVINVFNALPGPVKTAIAVGTGFVGVLSTMALTLSFILPQIPTLVKGFGLLKTGIASLGAIAGKVGAVISTSWLPITLTIAGVVAAVFILQDVLMALRGEGDTLTARVIAWGKAFGSGIIARVKEFSITWKVVSTVVRGAWGALRRIIDWGKAFGGAVVTRVQDFWQTLGRISHIFSPITRGLSRLLGWGREARANLVGPADAFGKVLRIAGNILEVVFVPSLIYAGAVAAGRFAMSIGRSITRLVSLGAQSAKAGLGIAKMGAQLLIAGVRQAATFTANIVQAGVALGVKLITGLAGATKTALAFNAALLANPITWVVVGIVALAAGIYLLVKHWDRAKAAVVNVWNTISESVGNAIQSAVDWFVTLPERTMAALGNWWQSIKDWFANTFNFGEVLSNAFNAAMNLIPAPLRGIAEKIMAFFPQSPAKEGPLTRLDAVGEGLVGEVAGGIERTSMAELESALDDLPLPSARRAVGTDYAAPVAAGSAAGMPYAPAITVNVQVDARGTTAEDAESIGQMTADKIRDILDQWVRENFRSVVMQEV